MKPRFSIIIPVYNRANLVKEALESVFAQTYPNYEVIAVDDGSKDNALEVLKSYEGRVTVIAQTNQGAEAARYNAMRASSGEYLVILDCDDLLTPNALAIYDQIIRTRNAPPIIIGALTIFQSGTEPAIDRGEAGTTEVIEYESLFTRDRPIGITCSQIVARRDVIEATGALRPNLTAFPFETADILLGLSAQSPWITVQRPTTIAYRLHDSNTIGNLTYMVNSAPKIIHLEKQGVYPGGSEKRFARWAYLGGVLWNWCREAMRAGKYRLATGLILKGAPMIACGIIRKISLKFRQKRAPFIITEAHVLLLGFISDHAGFC